MGRHEHDEARHAASSDEARHVPRSDAKHSANTEAPESSATKPLAARAQEYRAEQMRKDALQASADAPGRVTNPPSSKVRGTRTRGKNPPKEDTKTVSAPPASEPSPPPQL